MHEHRVPVADGGDLQVIDFGGAGPDVLCLHHIGFTPLQWRKVADALTGRCRVVALALRGHGSSSAHAVRGAQARHDLPLVAQHLQLQQPLLVLAGGVSSVIGLSAAIEYPQAFRSVVTVNGTIPRQREQVEDELGLVASPRVQAYLQERYCIDTVAATWADLELLVDAQAHGMAEDWLLDIPPDMRTEAFSAVRKVPGGWCLSPSLEAIVDHYDFDPEDHFYPGRHLYDELAMPLLVLHGKNSWDHRGEQVEAEISREQPPLRVEILPTGQFPMYTDPELLAHRLAGACGVTSGA